MPCEKVSNHSIFEMLKSKIRIYGLMLFNVPLLFGHGVIVQPAPRALIGSDPTLPINNDDLYKNLTGQPQAPQAPTPLGNPTVLKTNDQLAANLAALNQTYPGLAPCRYNNQWQPTNVFNPGSAVNVSWEMPIPHPGTCNFQLLKNGQPPQQLGFPYLCSQPKAANGTLAGEFFGNTAVTIPAGTSCTAEDQCSLQWFWNGDKPDDQYVNCVDFTTGQAQTNAIIPGGVPPAIGTETTLSTIAQVSEASTLNSNPSILSSQVSSSPDQLVSAPLQT